VASLPPYTLWHPYFLTLIEGNKECGSEEKLKISEKINTLLFAALGAASHQHG
jgi:hypothetical protein